MTPGDDVPPDMWSTLPAWDINDSPLTTNAIGQLSQGQAATGVAVSVLWLYATLPGVSDRHAAQRRFPRLWIYVRMRTTTPQTVARLFPLHTLPKCEGEQATSPVQTLTSMAPSRPLHTTILVCSLPSPSPLFTPTRPTPPPTRRAPPASTHIVLRGLDTIRSRPRNWRGAMCR